MRNKGLRKDRPNLKKEPLDAKSITMAYAMGQLVQISNDVNTMFVLLTVMSCSSPSDVKWIVMLSGYSDRIVRYEIKHAVENGWLQAGSSPYHKKRIMYSITEEGKDQLRRWIWFLENYMLVKYNTIRDERASIWNSLRDTDTTERKADSRLLLTTH